MKISIDEEKCIGCGNCVPNCHLGIIEVRDGKARVINPELCDGMGRCLGHCPTGALSLIDEGSPSPVSPIPSPSPRFVAPFTVANPHPESHQHPFGGCPGSQVLDRRPRTQLTAKAESHRLGAPLSELKQWPVQLKLLPAKAPFFQGSDLVLTADCVAYARGDFHDRFLRGRVIAIACPKLDSERDGYLTKLTTMIAEAGLRSVQVVHMEVPCCHGLWELARQAWERARQPIPLRKIIISLDGEIIEDAWASEQD